MKTTKSLLACFACLVMMCFSSCTKQDLEDDTRLQEDTVQIEKDKYKPPTGG